MSNIVEEQFCPNAFHKKLAFQKKLANEEGKLLPHYFALSLFYRNLLEAYLGKLLNIQKLDDEISNSGLRFLSVPKEERDIYQKFSCYQYFYLRNTIYIEKLTLQDIGFLEDKLKNRDGLLDEKTKEFLQRTYPLLITSDIAAEEIITNYGPFSSTFFAPVNAIVFGMRCSDDFSAPDDEWLEINFKQQNFLENMKNKLNEEWKNQLNCPLQFLVYDDESVKENKLTLNMK